MSKSNHQQNKQIHFPSGRTTLSGADLLLRVPRVRFLRPDSPVYRSPAAPVLWWCGGVSVRGCSGKPQGGTRYGTREKAAAAAEDAAALQQRSLHTLHVLLPLPSASPQALTRRPEDPVPWVWILSVLAVYELERSSSPLPASSVGENNGCHVNLSIIHPHARSKVRRRLNS